MASFDSDAVVVLDRAPDGTLTQRTGTAGCVSQTGAGPCVDGTALDAASSVTVSPDGASAYVASFSDGVAVFDREVGPGSGGDITPPDTTIDPGPSGTTGDPSPSFAFSSSEAGSTFECRLDGPGGTTGAFATCGSPQDYSGLAEGSYTFQVRATDGVGNQDQSSAQQAFTVDTPPQTTIDSGPSGATNDPNPSFGFSSDQAGSTFECRLDGPGSATGTFAACTSPKSYSGLADGDYTFQVRATDGSSNTDASGNDRMLGGADRDRMLGGGGRDRISGQSGRDRMSGQSGPDTMFGGSGPDTMFGGSGEDSMLGKAGDDRLQGSRGDDRLSGSRGDDVLIGDQGRDVLRGDQGRNRLIQ